MTKDAAQPPKVPYDEIQEYWNNTDRLGTLHHITKIRTPRRMRFLRTRWKEDIFRENWKKIIDIANRSKFLCFKFKGFSFNWVIKNEDNYIKILEKKYNHPGDDKLSWEEKERINDAWRG
jgi:hypothetical protein